MGSDGLGPATVPLTAATALPCPDPATLRGPPTMIDMPPALPPAPASPIPLEDFAAELLGLYDEPHRSRSTRSHMRQVLGEVMGIPGMETTADLTPEAVARFVRGMTVRGLSRVTIDGLVDDLRQVCDYGVRRGYLPSNPVEFRRHWLPYGYEPRPPGPDVAALSREELTRLMVHLLDWSTSWEGHRLYALVATVFLAGLRRAEALELPVANCDLERLTIRVTRGAVVRRKRPMPAKLAEILGEWLPRTGARWAFPGTRLAGPWTGGPTGQKPLCRLKAAGQAAGIPGLTFERLRDAWLAAEGRVALGPEFIDRPTPHRPYGVPQPSRPGPKPKPDALDVARPAGNPAVLTLAARDLPPIVRGSVLSRKLAPGAFHILQAMLTVGSPLTGPDLAKRSGYRDPVRVFRRLVKDRADGPIWKTVILFPGRKGEGGYRLAKS